MAGTTRLELATSAVREPSTLIPREPGYCDNGSAAMPQKLEDWRDYVRAVATPYKGHIHEYEIWNEASSRHFFTGSVDEMLLLTKEACDILKKIDPSNVVVSHSAPDARGILWLEEFSSQKHRP